ncbi:MAG: ABC transporter substrate-binding protein [Actinobacteria bacterium]|nr:ABC transporter substrate-binding protein [Actinomycetota bacterium]MCL6104465.1 ABC transporter substrate-binding protein [Actinomycetota bacterium]
MVLLIALSFTAGCSQNNTSAAGSAKSAHGQVPGDTLRLASDTLVVGITHTVADLNPNTVQGDSFVTQQIADLTLPQPFYINPKLQVVYNPNLLYSAELVRLNPQTVVYKINPSAVWSNGTPITGEDFVYNWHLHTTGIGEATGVAATPYEFMPNLGYSEIHSMTVSSSSSKTVTVVFNSPFPDWELLFRNLMPEPSRQPALSAPLSGGPFEVKQDINRQHIVLIDNPKWWGQKPGLKSIVFQYIPSSQVVQSMRQKKIDMFYSRFTSESLMQAVSGLDWVDSVSDPGTYSYQLVFNQANPFLAIHAVREAIAKATDRQSLLNDTVGQLNPAIGLDDNHLFTPGESFYQNNASGYNHPHLAQAAALLSRGGFLKLNGQWLTVGAAMSSPSLASLVNQPISLRIAVSSSDSLAMEIANLFVAQMANIGIKVVQQDVSHLTLYNQLLPSHNFDIALIRTRAPVFPLANEMVYANPTVSTVTSSALSPTTNFTTSTTSTTTTSSHSPAVSLLPEAGSQDYNTYGDVQVNNLFQKAQSELSPIRAQTAYNRIDNILWLDMPSLPLFQAPTLLAYSAGYSGITDNTSYMGPFWDAQLWNVKIFRKHTSFF